MEFLMQPIRRTVVMKEVNDNELPLEPQLYPALATGTEELPPMATGSIGGQICAADVVAGAEGDDEPQASEQSIGSELELLLRRGHLAMDGPAPLRRQFTYSLRSEVTL